MGLSDGAIIALMCLACICGLIVAFPFVLLIEACGRRWSTLPRGHAMAFVDYAVYLYARASKAVSSNSSSTSELPHSEIHRRRDLIGGYPMLHEYPGVIPSYDSRSERMLNRYGRYLNVYAKIPDTNATVFRIRSWLRNCEKNHNGRNGNPHCQPLDEDGRGYPLWLIDIEQRCVVPFQASLSYFALSYVWGCVDTAKMERSNLAQLRQPGSLLGPRQVVELPNTIKDAMFLTGFLGHRYLWCDRLCLVQDDISSKLPQIRHMAEIYARAYCTIIAFDNLDANSGLHGLAKSNEMFSSTIIDVFVHRASALVLKGLDFSRGVVFGPNNSTFFTSGQLAMLSLTRRKVYSWLESKHHKIHPQPSTQTSYQDQWTWLSCESWWHVLSEPCFTRILYEPGRKLQSKTCQRAAS